MRMRKRRNDEHNSPIRNNTWRPFVLLFFKKIIFCRFWAKNHYLCMVWWWVKRNCPNWLLHATKFSFFFLLHCWNEFMNLKKKKLFFFGNDWYLQTEYYKLDWSNCITFVSFFIHRNAALCDSKLSARKMFHQFMMHRMRNQNKYIFYLLRNLILAHTNHPSLPLLLVRRLRLLSNSLNVFLNACSNFY